MPEDFETVEISIDISVLNGVPISIIEGLYRDRGWIFTCEVGRITAVKKEVSS